MPRRWKRLARSQPERYDSFRVTWSTHQRCSGEVASSGQPRGAGGLPAANCCELVTVKETLPPPPLSDCWTRCLMLTNGADVMLAAASVGHPLCWGFAQHLLGRLGQQDTPPL
jgi:hypothetical protein